jgi:hypothetical protein
MLCIICFIIMTSITAVNIQGKRDLENVPPRKRLFQVLDGGTIGEAAVWIPQHRRKSASQIIRSNLDETPSRHGPHIIAFRP